MATCVFSNIPNQEWSICLPNGISTRICTWKLLVRRGLAEKCSKTETHLSLCQSGWTKCSWLTNSQFWTGNQQNISLYMDPWTHCQCPLAIPNICSDATESVCLNLSVRCKIVQIERKMFQFYTMCVRKISCCNLLLLGYKNKYLISKYLSVWIKYQLWILTH